MIKSTIAAVIPFVVYKHSKQIYRLSGCCIIYVLCFFVIDILFFLVLKFNPNNFLRIYNLLLAKFFFL